MSESPEKPILEYISSKTVFRGLPECVRPDWCLTGLSSAIACSSELGRVRDGTAESGKAVQRFSTVVGDVGSPFKVKIVNL